MAELFAADGARLILVSRNIQNLEALKADLESRYAVTATIMARDLSKPFGAEALALEVFQKGFSVDVLVNNAGFGVYGNFADEPLEPQLGMIELHVRAPTVLSYAFLPGMMKAKRGGILNVASTGGFQPVPVENVYCATKAYTLHFSEALTEELLDSGVKVTCLCPGPTQTPFFDTALMKSCAPIKASRMDSKKVAQMGFDAFKRGKPLVITGFWNKFLIFMERFGSRRTIIKTAHSIVRQKAK